MLLKIVRRKWFLSSFSIFSQRILLLLERTPGCWFLFEAHHKERLFLHHKERLRYSEEEVMISLLGGVNICAN